MMFLFGGEELLTTDEIKAGAIYGNAGFDEQQKLRKGKLCWLTLGEAVDHTLSTDKNKANFNKRLQEINPSYRKPLTWASLIKKRLDILHKNNFLDWNSYQSFKENKMHTT